MVRLLTEAEKQQIEEAVKLGEGRIRGEIVTVIARQADSYDDWKYIYAFIFGFIAAGALAYFSLFTYFSYLPAMQLGFLCLMEIISYTSAFALFIPAKVMRYRAARLAKLQFLERNLHATSSHQGILIFVAAFEHYAEIIADGGISEFVEKGQWQEIVASFTGRLKQGKAAEGFIQAIRECSALLEKYFPEQREDKNFFPDSIIEI